MSTYLYENWQLFRKQDRFDFRIGFDYLLYSDADVENLNVCTLGPNTLFFGETHAANTGLVRHVCTLRNLHYYEFEEFEPPWHFRIPTPFDPTLPPESVNESNTWMYTGLDEPQELLAVLALEWGVRLYCSSFVAKVSPLRSYGFSKDQDDTDREAQKQYPWALTHWPHPIRKPEPTPTANLHTKSPLPAIGERKIIAPSLTPNFPQLSPDRGKRCTPHYHARP